MECHTNQTEHPESDRDDLTEPVLLAGLPGHRNQRRFGMQNTMLLIGCMAAWGLAVFLMKIAGQKLGPYTCSVFALPGYLLVGLLISSRADYHISMHHGLAVAIGALYMAGNMAFYKLCQTQDVTALAPLTSVYIILPIVMGWMLLGEPISVRRILGIALAVAAVVLLNWPERSPAP